MQIVYHSELTFLSSVLSPLVFSSAMSCRLISFAFFALI